MPEFSRQSWDRLRTCDNQLQRLFAEVVRHFDCSVLCGHRTQKEQDAAFSSGASKLKWPQGMHNKTPSLAVDVAPYNDAKKPVDWDDTRRFYLFSGYVLGVAAQMGIKIRWGGDWNRDTHVKDNSFNDLVHFELA